MHDLGIIVPYLVAGFSGGVVNAFVSKRADPWSITGSVVVGALTANYLAEPVAQLAEPIGRFIGFGPNAAAFMIGAGGPSFVQMLIRSMKQRIIRSAPPAAGGSQ